MKLLELFSGSGSMGKAFAEKGWEVTSLDLDPKTEATIKQNILTWNFSEYPVGFSMRFGPAHAVHNTPVPGGVLRNLGT